LVLDTVEAYLPTMGPVGAVARLSAPRASFAAATGGDGRVYAIGGWNSGGNLVSVEAYSADDDRWDRVADLNMPHAWFSAAAAADGRIFAFGAYLGEPIVLDTVEAYGPRLFLEASAVARGGVVRLSGVNFAALARAIISFGTAQTQVAEATTDEVGQLSAASFGVPDVAPGTYPLVVVDQRSRYAASAVLTIE
jgi:hypothetical protein